MKSITQQFVEILKKSSLSTPEKVTLVLDMIGIVEERDKELLELFDDFSEVDILADLPKEFKRKMEDSI